MDTRTEQSDLASACPRVCLPIAIQSTGGQLQKIFPGRLDIHASFFYSSLKGLWSFAFSKNPEAFTVKQFKPVVLKL